MDVLPSITVKEVAAKIENGDDLIVLDVREMNEVDRVSLPTAFLEMPLSEIEVHGADAIPAELEDELSAEIVVMCHHGSRSAMVTKWLLQQGYTNVKNITGGIHAYALEVEPAIGTY